MACRTYDRVLKCGCMVSSDGGGGLISCEKIGDKCKYGKWLRTKDYKLFEKEVIEKNM